MKWIIFMSQLIISIPICTHFLVEADKNLLSTSFQLMIFQICFT